MFEMSLIETFLLVTTAVLMHLLYLKKVLNILIGFVFNSYVGLNKNKGLRLSEEVRL